LQIPEKIRQLFLIEKVNVRKHLLQELLVLSVLVGILVMSFVLTPRASGIGTHTRLGLPPCSFYKLTGMPCPGCGLTTSFSYMARLHIVSAFQAHPFGPVFFTALLCILVHHIILLFSGYSITFNISVRAEAITFLTLFIIFIVFSIGRGLYYFYYVLH